MEANKPMLLEWWKRYARAPYTLEELKKFEEVVDEYGVGKVLEVAVASCIAEDGSPTVFLECIRRETVKELMDSLPDISKLPEKERQSYQFVKKEFIERMSLCEPLE